MTTTDTDPAALLDQIAEDAATHPEVAAAWSPALVATVRAVLALADELDDVAHDYRHAAGGSHDAGARNAHLAIADRLRAAVTDTLGGAR